MNPRIAQGANKLYPGSLLGHGRVANARPRATPLGHRKKVSLAPSVPIQLDTVAPAHGTGSASVTFSPGTATFFLLSAVSDVALSIPSGWTSAGGSVWYRSTTPSFPQTVTASGGEVVMAIASLEGGTISVLDLQTTSPAVPNSTSHVTSPNIPGPTPGVTAFVVSFTGLTFDDPGNTYGITGTVPLSDTYSPGLDASDDFPYLDGGGFNAFLNLAIAHEDFSPASGSTIPGDVIHYSGPLPNDATRFTGGFATSVALTN